VSEANDFTEMLGPAQLLDDGLGQVLIDFGMPRHRLGLLCAGVCIPVVSPAMADQSTTHVLQYLDKLAPFHLRDQEFFYFADIGHFARFNILKEIRQVLCQFALGRSLRLIVRILIEKTDVELSVTPIGEANFFHE
jgi:hypothetical protein